MSHLRLYSLPATIGWSSVMIFTPSGGTEERRDSQQKIMETLLHLHMMSSVIQVWVGRVMLLLEARQR